MYVHITIEVTDDLKKVVDTTFCISKLATPTHLAGSLRLPENVGCLLREKTLDHLISTWWTASLLPNFRLRSPPPAPYRGALKGTPTPASPTSPSAGQRSGNVMPVHDTQTDPYAPGVRQPIKPKRVRSRTGPYNRK